MKNVPVPVYCRPLVEKDPNRKVGKNREMIWTTLALSSTAFYWGFTDMWPLTMCINYFGGVTSWWKCRMKEIRPQSHRPRDSSATIWHPANQVLLGKKVKPRSGWQINVNGALLSKQTLHLLKHDSARARDLQEWLPTSWENTFFPSICWLHHICCGRLLLNNVGMMSHEKPLYLNVWSSRCGIMQQKDLCHISANLEATSHTPRMDFSGEEILKHLVSYS